MDLQKVSIEQLSYFQRIYDHEIERCSELVNRGKIYLSIITLYMGLLGVAADKVVPMLVGKIFVIPFYLLGICAFAIALVFIVMAIGIYRYVYPSDPKTILIESNSSWPNNDDFFLARIAELASAFEHNHPINDKRASRLKWASRLMVFGVICQAVVISALIFIQ